MSEISKTIPFAAQSGATHGQVQIVLRLEALAVLAGSCAAYAALHASWVSFALLFLLPDLGMLGYLIGPRMGAACYNCAHSYVAPAVLVAIGHSVAATAVYPLALIWVAHIGFDRMLGYGLKYPTGFGDTHLVRLGRSAATTAMSRGMWSQRHPASR